MKLVLAEVALNSKNVVLFNNTKTLTVQMSVHLQS